MIVRSLPAALVVLLLAGCGGDSERGSGDEVQLGATTAERPTGPRTDTAPPGQDERAPARPKRSAARRPSANRVPSRPPIVERRIPFDRQRVEQTAAYSQRHYGDAKTRLDPKVIVEHFTVLRTAGEVIDLFSKNEPDVELRERPGVCSHFLVDRDGTIFQLVPVTLICRHTVGLNDVAIGIEHVGSADSEVMNNPAQLRASLRLTRWLRCRYGIAWSNVIGHAESLSSPFHHEAVRALARQTHDDFQPATMERYRARLERRDC